MTDENDMQFLHAFLVAGARNILKSLAPFYRWNTETRGRKCFIWQAGVEPGAGSAAAARCCAALGLSKYIQIDDRSRKYMQ